MIDAVAARVRRAFAETAVAPSAATPLFLVGKGALETDAAAAPAAARAFARATGFQGAAGETALAPGEDGRLAVGFFGLGPLSLGDGAAEAQIGAAPRLPPPAPLDGGESGGAVGGEAGAWRLEGRAVDPARAALEWALGAYRFERYTASEKPIPPLATGLAETARARVLAQAEAVYLARDLVNTPTNDLDPAALEAAMRALAARHGAEMTATVDGALLDAGFPLIHAVGRAGSSAPRLLDLAWGASDAPKITVVGKGVCFDTGGLDIKPPRAMRLMKKDMGGAASALALAHMVMSLELPVRLRVLIPAVENSVAAASFRPGDVLNSRKGLTVEIGDTDAEGRLILADALTLAGEESPDLLFDLATLTGAARAALGPELPPYYTDNEGLADEIAASAAAVGDPLWRMPLWPGYAGDLSSRVADLSNISTTGFAGSITAALFLKRFVGGESGGESARPSAKAWAHFDIYAWNPKTRPGRPEGGEAQAARALFHLLERRYNASA